MLNVNLESLEKFVEIFGEFKRLNKTDALRHAN